MNVERAIEDIQVTGKREIDLAAEDRLTVLVDLDLLAVAIDSFEVSPDSEAAL